MKDYNVIKKSLSWDEFISFANNVVNWCFGDGLNENAYTPEYKSIQIKINFAKYYTDIELTGDISKDYELVKNIDVSTPFIKQVQFNDLINTIDLMIDAKRAEIAQYNPLNELVEILIEVLNKVDEKLSAVDVNMINEQISKLNARNLISQYFKTERAETNHQEVVDEKNKKIRELKGKLNSVSARHVKADK